MKLKRPERPAEQSFTCHLCSGEFSHVTTLRRHLRSHRLANQSAGREEEGDEDEGDEEEWMETEPEEEAKNEPKRRKKRKKHKPEKKKVEKMVIFIGVPSLLPLWTLGELQSYIIDLCQLM